MVKLSKGLGPVKRFGVRYGRTTKNKRAKIEIEQRKKQKCPYCSRLSAKRVSFGVWNCTKCNSQFTARAYSVGEKISLAKEVSHFVAELPRLRAEEGEEE